ncbi:hypothetical protein QE363_002762 [Sphingomonas sp. SORGH_AS870]|nr:hypothetical protein [Sphingomonas sp. SORGH_AS_0870]
MPRAVSEADGIIQPLPRQIDPIVVDRHAQVDVRMGGREIVQPCQQPAGGEGPDHADVQHILEPPIGEAIQRRADSVERLRQHRHQRLPVIGQRQPTRQAVEQPRPQPFLQPCDLMADRALADAQLDRRAGEVQMPCRRLEGAQGVERQLGAVHASS